MKLRPSSTFSLHNTLVDLFTLTYDCAKLKLTRELEDVNKHIRTITVELDTIFQWRFLIRNKEVLVNIPEDGVTVPNIYVDDSWQKETISIFLILYYVVASLTFLSCLKFSFGILVEPKTI